MKHFLIFFLLIANLSAFAQSDSTINNPKKTFRMSVEASGDFGSYADDFCSDGFDLAYGVGWKKPHSYFGFGVSSFIFFDHYYTREYTSAKMESTFPVFADIRWDVLNKNVSPFIDFRFGYAFDFSSYNNYNGVFAYFGIGVNFGHFGVSVGEQLIFPKGLTADSDDWGFEPSCGCDFDDTDFFCSCLRIRYDF